MFKNFSDSQLLAMSWWYPNSGYFDREAIICDGAVRSGKTVCMALGFFLWAQSMFSGQMFALCGKSIKSLRRNVLKAVLPLLEEQGFKCRELISSNTLTVQALGHKNEFHIFGGMDSSSAALIQGATFAGALFDEVALMPRSFVEQAVARCSCPGARLWFNCNPEGPQHWFYREWICRREEKKALYVHFRLEDNPGLSRNTIERYKRIFTGAMHRRFIQGEWTAAQGAVYDFFSDDMLFDPPAEQAGRWAISCDYGTSNPASFGLWGEFDGSWYRVDEFYFDSGREGRQMTDGEYVSALERLADGRRIDFVTVDPSAASFILALGRAGFHVIKAKNDVSTGIRLTAQALREGKLRICRGCTDAIREFYLYRWAGDGRDAPLKENDHAMDDIRYFACTVFGGGGRETFAMAVERRGRDQQKYFGG